MKDGEGKRLRQNSAKMITASVVGQLIVWLAYPLLTRLYSPDELGTMSLFLAIVGVLSIAASGQYENAIMIEKRDEDASSVTFLCLLTGLAVSVITMASCLFLYYHFASVPYFVLWIAPLVLLSSWGYILSYWYNRGACFNRTASYQVVERFSTTLSRVAFGWAGSHDVGLIIGSVMGQFIGLFTLVPVRRKFFFMHVGGLLEKAKKWHLFPMFTLPHKEINALALNLPVFVFSAWLDMAEVGLFALALNVGLRPLWSFGRSVHQVYYQKMGRRGDKRDYNARLFRGVCVGYLRWAIPLVLVLYLTLPAVTEWLFGAQWTRVGNLLQTMLPWIAASTLVHVLSFVPNVYGKQAKAFVVEIISVVLELSVLIVGVLIGDLEMAVSLLSIVCSLIAMAQLAWYYLIIRDYGRRP